MVVPAVRSNPYVGPRAFQRGETLYGRDREVLELLDLLIAERIVLLYSPSGAGKTSLVQAALIPELEAEGFQVLPPVRAGLEPPETQRPANRYVLSALWSLEEGLPAEAQTPLEGLAGLTVAEYLDRRAAVPIEGAPSGGTGGAGVVLVFDQFEEVLTVDPTDREAKAEFFAEVGEALRDWGRWALFAMREEFVAGLDPYLRPVPTRLATRYRLELLGEGEARLAVQEPARGAGVEFTGSAAVRLVDDLRRVRVQRPDGTAEEQLGPYVEPVQLQVVCRRLWEELPADDVEIDETDLVAVGDVDTALRGYYGGQVAAVASATGVREQAIREWFDRQLITEYGIRGQVLQGPERSGGLANRAIWPLVDAHLVRAEQRRGATWFELAHDRLIEPVRMDNHAWFEQHQSPLMLAARIWLAADRDPEKLVRGERLRAFQAQLKAAPAELADLEREFLSASVEAARLQAAKRLRLVLSGAAIVLALLSILTAWAVYSAADANRQRATAAVAEGRAVAGQQTAESAQSTAAVDQQLAVTALAVAYDALTREASLRPKAIDDAVRANQTQAAAVQATSDAEAAHLEATLAALGTQVAGRPTPSSTPFALPSPGTPPPLGSPIGLTPNRTETAVVATEIALMNATDDAAATGVAEIHATQTASARCPFEPQGAFLSLWQKEEHQGRLGCPLSVEPIDGYFAEEPFERGYMYWVQLPDWFFVIIGTDRGPWYLIKQAEATWPWNAGTSCDADPAPGPGQIQPIRGFGGVWCARGDIREAIGFATAPEMGMTGNLLQEFEGGFVLRDSRGYVYVMYRAAEENFGDYVRE